MPTFIDSHCHFDFAAFDEDRYVIWQQCQTAGVKQLIIPGTQPQQWQHALKVSQQFNGIYMAAGFHPWWIDTVGAIDDVVREHWQKQLAEPDCVAIGECGIDNTRSTPMDQQMAFFLEHLKLACDAQLPLIIHLRKSHNETLKELQRYRPKAGGVIHGFSGSLECAQQYWQLGFYLGIGGTITYSRANKTRNTVRQIPLDAIVLETDAPDMPLAGHQGQRNTPLQIPIIAQTLADLRNESLETIADITTKNTKELFSL